MTITLIGENTGDDLGGNSIDANLDENSPTTNFGTDSTFWLRADTPGDIRNPICAFPDITDISGPVTVSAATCYWWQVSRFGDETFTAVCRKILRNWVESEVTWNIWSTGNNWTTAGALSDGNDRNATVSATGELNDTSGEYKSFTGAQLATDCQNDINGITNHYGWTWERTDDENSSLRELGTSEYTDGLRPYISITHEAGGGWTGTINGVTNPSSVNGIAVAGITNISGVT